MEISSPPQRQKGMYISLSFLPLYRQLDDLDSLTHQVQVQEVATNTGRCTFIPWATNMGRPTCSQCSRDMGRPKENRQISTFRLTGGALCLSFIVTIVVIYRVRARVSVIRVRVRVRVKVSIT